MSEGAVFQSQFVRAITAKRPPASAPPSFTVYRNTWLKGLLDALDANYPTVAMLLGADLFKTVALEFARNQPPSTPVLALYGAQFPDFLQAHRIGREIPYLGDVARLERLWTECFFAPDAAAWESSRFAMLRPDEMFSLRLRLHPATRFERFETPAVSIWQAHRTDGEFEELELDWRSEHALVTRRGMQILVSPINEPTRRLLVEIQRGETIGGATAATVKTHPGCNLTDALTTLISSAALAEPRLEDERI